MNAHPTESRTKIVSHLDNGKKTGIISYDLRFVHVPRGNLAPALNQASASTVAGSVVFTASPPMPFKIELSKGIYSHFCIG